MRLGKLYWSDREGMRVMRCNLDGSNIETVVVTGGGAANKRDQARWCVGIAIDPKRGQIYWTQKGPDNGEPGRIFRAGIDLPSSESPGERTTSKCSTTVCQSPSTSSSISRTA